MAETGISSNFTNKQKITAGLFVLILVFLIYQVIGLFGNSNTITPQAPAVQQQTASKVAPPSPASVTNATTTAAPGMTAPAPQQPPSVIQQVQPLKGLVAVNNDALKKQQEQQQQYLSTINELQMLKLQKDIAETNQAISAAKLATATAERNIGDLFIKQAPLAATPSASDYANKLVTEGGPTTQPPVQVQMPPLQGVPQAAYVVISVSMQMHRWTAVIGAQNKLYNVSVGDILPPDGSVVVSINKEGVFLKKDNVERKVSLVPVI